MAPLSIATTKKPDLSALSAEMKRLGGSDELVALLLGLLESMADQNSQLQFRLAVALRQLWRPKSEKVSAEQLALFLAKLPPAEAEQAHVETTLDSAASVGGAAADDDAKPTRKKPRGKQPFPPNLQRRIEPVPVPEALRRCACGAEKRVIGHDTQFVWDFEPAVFFLRERQLEKRACKICEDGVTCAPAPGKPILGARPGPGLLAQIVTAKFHDACPLYRQSQIYERSGIHLAPSTLGDWCADTADVIEPVWKFLRTQTLDSYLVSLDDTKLPVLDREDPRGIKRGHIWTYIGDEGRAAFCEYTPDWSGDAPQKVLAESKARVIQGDGYAGIDAVFTVGPDPPKRAGCMDHARRRWVVALESGDARAAIVVKLMADVYAVEAAARADKLGPDELLERRRAKSRPIMDRLKRVIADLAVGALPKSPVGKATTYAINQWPTLEVFLDDGRVPLSNAHVERQQRRTVLGRKNYLFSGSDDGARRLAILQTIVVNCNLAKVPMWQYLRDTLARLADGWPQSRLAELTPAAWATAAKKTGEQAKAQ